MKNKNKKINIILFVVLISVCLTFFSNAQDQVEQVWVAKPDTTEEISAEDFLSLPKEEQTVDNFDKLDDVSKKEIISKADFSNPKDKLIAQHYFLGSKKGNENADRLNENPETAKKFFKSIGVNFKSIDGRVISINDNLEILASNGKFPINKLKNEFEFSIDKDGKLIISKTIPYKIEGIEFIDDEGKEIKTRELKYDFECFGDCKLEYNNKGFSIIGSGYFNGIYFENGIRNIKTSSDKYGIKYSGITKHIDDTEFSKDTLISFKKNSDTLYITLPKNTEVITWGNDVEIIGKDISFPNYPIRKLVKGRVKKQDSNKYEIYGSIIDEDGSKFSKYNSFYYLIDKEKGVISFKHFLDLDNHAVKNFVYKRHNNVLFLSSDLIPLESEIVEGKYKRIDIFSKYGEVIVKEGNSIISSKNGDLTHKGQLPETFYLTSQGHFISKTGSGKCERVCNILIYSIQQRNGLVSKGDLEPDLRSKYKEGSSLFIKSFIDSEIKNKEKDNDAIKTLGIAYEFMDLEQKKELIKNYKLFLQGNSLDKELIMQGLTTIYKSDKGENKEDIFKIIISQKEDILSSEAVSDALFSIYEYSNEEQKNEIFSTLKLRSSEPNHAEYSIFSLARIYEYLEPKQKDEAYDIFKSNFDNPDYLNTLSYVYDEIYSESDEERQNEILEQLKSNIKKDPESVLGVLNNLEGHASEFQEKKRLSIIVKAAFDPDTKKETLSRIGGFYSESPKQFLDILYSASKDREHLEEVYSSLSNIYNYGRPSEDHKARILNIYLSGIKNGDQKAAYELSKLYVEHHSSQYTWTGLTKKYTKSSIVESLEEMSKDEKVAPLVFSTLAILHANTIKNEKEEITRIIIDGAKDPKTARYAISEIINSEDLRENEEIKEILKDASNSEDEYISLYAKFAKIEILKDKGYERYGNRRQKVSRSQEDLREEQKLISEILISLEDQDKFSELVKSPADVENIRFELNKLDSSHTKGDKWLFITVGKELIQSSKGITREQIFTKDLTQQIESIKEWKNINAHQDAKGMYEANAMFAANQIVDKILEDRSSCEQNPYCTKTMQQLEEIGIDFDEREGDFNKVVRTLRDRDFISASKYILQKGWDKGAYWLSSNSLFKNSPSEWGLGNQGLGLGEGENQYFQVKIDSKPTILEDEEIVTSKQGYKVTNLLDKNDNPIAALVIGDPDKGARVYMDVKPGEGVSEKEIKTTVGRTKIVTDFPIAYTTGSLKPVGFAASKGKPINWLIGEKKDGLVIVTEKGMKVLDIRDIKRSDVTPDLVEEDKPLDIRGNPEDFYYFIQQLEKQKATVVSSTLLARDSKIEDINDDHDDRRRFILTFDDGHFAMIDFNERMPTKKATQYALSIPGVKDVVYCDTGYYDRTSIYDDKGVQHVIGHADKKGSNNRIAFFQE
jgi:hypothetical protein